MAFNFAEECRKYQVNPTLAKQIDRKLYSLLEKAVDFPPFNMFLAQKQAASRKLMENITLFMNFVHVKVKQGLLITPKELSILFLFDYLVTTESLYTYIVDIISFALICIGKELKDPRTQQEVVLFEELKKVALGTKLDFLRTNRLGLIANRCSVSLRNAAAHMDFELDDEGNITYDGQVITNNEMNEYHDKIRDATICSHIALMHFYYEKYGKYVL